MIKKVFAGAFTASVVCGFAGCASLHVTSDVNTPLASSVKCHSFEWAGSFRGSDALRSSVANPVNEARLRAAIESNMSAAGVQLASSGADCLVGYGIGNRNVVDGYPYGWGWGGGWGWRGGWYGAWGWDYPYVYSEGIIGVDLYDARTRQAFWHATAQQNLEGVSGEKADQKIKTAVAAIFTKYPHT